MTRNNNIARTRRALIKLALQSLRQQERERQQRLFVSLPYQSGPLRERAALYEEHAS